MLCSIILGVVIVSLILGENGVGTAARNLWRSEYEYRSIMFVNSDKVD